MDFDTLIEDLPPVARTDRVVRACQRALAVELEAANQALDQMRANTTIATALDDGLALWETVVGLPVRPPISLENRRAAISAYLLRGVGDGSGAAWEDVIQSLINGAWVYATHEAADGSSPDFDHITVEIPFEPGSPKATSIRRLLESITPATVVIDISYGGHFILDVSELDVSTL